jgi:hypothetical protein
MNELIEEMNNIEYALRILYHELNAQLSEGFVNYDIEFGGEKFRFDAYTTQEERNRFIKLLLDDAMEVSTRCAVSDDLEGIQAWSRIIQFISMRVKKEDIVSPLYAEEYQEIKKLKSDAHLQILPDFPDDPDYDPSKMKKYRAAIDRLRSRPVDLDSLYVNMQRDTWAEEDQIALLERKAKDVD